MQRECDKNKRSERAAKEVLYEAKGQSGKVAYAKTARATAATARPVPTIEAAVEAAPLFCLVVDEFWLDELVLLELGAEPELLGVLPLLLEPEPDEEPELEPDEPEEPDEPDEPEEPPVVAVEPAAAAEPLELRHEVSVPARTATVSL